MEGAYISAKEIIRPSTEVTNINEKRLDVKKNLIKSTKIN